MAQRLDRRPGDKAGPELPQERLARQKQEVNLDQATKDSRRALEKAQGAGEVDAEAAAQLQQQMGNAAMQGMVKESTDTDTATTSAEATLDKAREEQQEEEQDEDKDAGDLEQVLPSFSTGGGGAAGDGSGASSPWSGARMFGGDAPPDDALAGPGKPRWRPMPLAPDPDDDAEIEAIAEGDVAAEAVVGSLGGAEAIFGSVSWSPGVLSRGLRYPARLVGAVLGAGGAADPLWCRARACLRFLAQHANDPAARALAAGAAAVGQPDETPLVLAVAQELALVEAVLAHLTSSWHGVCDAAVDSRARPRVEGAAAELGLAGLSARALLSRTLGTNVAPAGGERAGTAHPAALAALSAVAHLAPFPVVDPWRPPAPDLGEEDPVLRALDAFLVAETGGATPELRPVAALYAQLDAALVALGGVQVEVAAAGLAAWPWLPEGVAEAVMYDADIALRQLARKVMAAGRAVEAAAAARDAGAITASSAEAIGFLARGEFVRGAALVALAGPLLDCGEPVAPPADMVWEGRLTAGHAEVLKIALGRVEPVAAFAQRVRLEGALAAAEPISRQPGDAALLDAAARVAAGDLPAAAVRVARWVGEGSAGPYGLVWAATLSAYARRDAQLLSAAGPAVAAHQEAGALNLLKAAWAELA